MSFQPGNKFGGGKPGRSGRKSRLDEWGLEATMRTCWTMKARRATIRKLSEMALEGNIDATRLLFAYAYGKPPQRHEISGPDREPVELIADVTVTEQLRRKLESLARASNAA
jgi:hypothetical protein